MMSLLKLLRKKFDRTLYTTPTHGQKSPFIKEFEGFYKFDFSEIVGFDNLQNPRGAILMSQGKASDIYDTKKTFFLVNGSTSGILAIMLALFQREDKILVARNCHKCVYSGVILTGVSIDWILPEENREWGIYGAVDLKKLENALKLNKYKAFFLTSPTYNGVNSDIEKISKLCKQYGTYLIVDEAHGALYRFCDKLPKTAIEQGADFSVNSLHKNAGSINPCALLHLSNNCIDFEWRKLQEVLNLITTTSPSYPALACIEANIKYLNSKNGKCEIEKLIKEISKLKKGLKKFGWEFFEEENSDPTKIVIKKYGICPKELSDVLFNKFKIEDEMTNQSSLLFLSGIGTTAKKLSKLAGSLKKIKLTLKEPIEATFQPYPFVKLRPDEASRHEYTYVSNKDALLKISAETITPFPPATPILYTGEVIQEWHLAYLNNDVKVLKK